MVSRMFVDERSTPVVAPSQELALIGRTRSRLLGARLQSESCGMPLIVSSEA